MTKRSADLYKHNSSIVDAPEKKPATKKIPAVSKKPVVKKTLTVEFDEEMFKALEILLKGEIAQLSATMKPTKDEKNLRKVQTELLKAWNETETK